MNKADISIFNKKNIKKGKLVDLIPEFYELKKVIQNNSWHNKESIFNHILSVVDNLEKIIRNSKKEIKQILSKIVGKNSRKSLLYVAALLHDIGKKETITDLGDGVRGCPGHEKEGAKKAEKILRRFNLSQKESKIIIDIVKNHSVIHYIIGFENKDFQEEYENFKKKFSNIYLELILLAFADTVGSYLRKTKPNEFRHRINFYKKELKNFPSN